jgi:hypothetical protein
MTPEQKEARVVSEPQLKYALECLRLEADCRQLAVDVHSPASQSHFLRMASFWSVSANQEPMSDPVVVDMLTRQRRP